MIQAVPKALTFAEFLEWYPDGKGRYELHNGIIVEMNPTGEHEEVAAFLNHQLVEGEYQVNLWRSSDQIQSLAFPNLELTAQQIFSKGGQN